MNPSTRAPIGFGIAGIGMIADFHAQAISRAEGAQLIGAVSRSAEKSRAFAERHGAPFSGSSLDEMLARPDLHVLCVTTPSGAHLQPALAAIAAGKHVLVEKPVEATTARADRIIDAAAAAGVRLAGIFQARFGQGAQAVKAAIDTGRLGRMVLASAYVKWHRTAAYYSGYRGSLALDGGGAVINQAIHAIDLLQWFAGMPAEVTARTTRRVHTGIEAEDSACATLRFASGALGVIEATTATWPGWSRRIEICGEKGSIALEDDRITRWDFQEAQTGDEAVRAGANGDALGSGAGNPSAISIEGHLRQIQDLVDAIRDNRPLAIDGQEARKAVAFVEAIYKSAETGQPASPA